MMNKLRQEYFEWMYNLIYDNKLSRNLSYKRLLYYLYNSNFTYLLDRDGNREADGIDFRYEFGEEVGYSTEFIRENLDTQPCSVLEMMVALSFRIEKQIMDDFNYGDRTGQWFWEMIISLGLGSMSDRQFNSTYVAQVLSRFLNRRYKPNGEGGLFTLNNPPKDLREVEIWYQAMWYLDESYDFTV